MRRLEGLVEEEASGEGQKLLSQFTFLSELIIGFNVGTSIGKSEEHFSLLFNNLKNLHVLVYQ